MAEHSAFTRTELLLALLALAALLLFVLDQHLSRPIEPPPPPRPAREQVGRLKLAVQAYESTTRMYPANLDELLSRPANPDASRQWNGPYIERLPLDPWDNPYRFAAPGKHNPDSFDVWSAGPDGRDGTDDDIGNWQ